MEETTIEEQPEYRKCDDPFDLRGVIVMLTVVLCVFAAAYLIIYSQ